MFITGFVAPGVRSQYITSPATGELITIFGKPCPSLFLDYIIIVYNLWLAKLASVLWFFMLQCIRNKYHDILLSYLGEDKITGMFSLFQIWII